MRRKTPAQRDSPADASRRYEEILPVGTPRAHGSVVPYSFDITSARPLRNSHFIAPKRAPIGDIADKLDGP